MFDILCECISLVLCLLYYLYTVVYDNEVLLLQLNDLKKRPKKRKWKCSRNCTLTGRVKSSAKIHSTKPFQDSTSRFTRFTVTDTFLAYIFVHVLYYTVLGM